MRTWERNVAVHSPLDLLNLGLVSVSKNIMTNEKVEGHEGTVGLESTLGEIRLDLINVTEVKFLRLTIFGLRDYIAGKLEIV